MDFGMQRVSFSKRPAFTPCVCFLFFFPGAVLIQSVEITLWLYLTEEGQIHYLQPHAKYIVPLISFLESLEYIYTTRQGGGRLYFPITPYLFHSAAESRGHCCYSPCARLDLLLGFLNQMRRFRATQPSSWIEGS